MLQEKEHLKKAVPMEACGVYTREKCFIACKNTVNELDGFSFCFDEYLDLHSSYTITGIVHSHVNNPNTASEHDIDNCNATGIPYYIYSYPSMELNIVLPKIKIRSKN